MAVTDLVQLTDNEIVAESAVFSKARQELAAAQNAERTARDAIAEEVREIHKLELDGGKPAELQRRRLAVVDLRRRELTSGADVRAAAASADRASARLAERQAERTTLVAQHSENTVSWPDQLAPFANLVSIANTRITELDSNVMALDVPDKLLDAVRTRMRVAIGRRLLAQRRVPRVAGTLATLDKANGGTPLSWAVKAREYEELRTTVAELLARANTVMTAADELAAAPPPAVPAPNRALLEAPGTLTAREAAADFETALHEAELTEIEKFDARELAELAKVADSTVDPQTAIDEHDAAVAAREQAEAEFTDAREEVVLAWQADAPKTVWNYVIRVEETLAALKELAQTNPPKMRTDLAKIEKELAETREEALDDLRSWWNTRELLNAVELQRQAMLAAPTVIGV